MNYLKAILYLFYSPLFHIGNPNLIGTEKYLQHIQSRLILEGVINIDQGVNLMDWILTEPQNFFGMTNKKINTSVFYSLIEYLPKNSLQARAVFEIYNKAIQKPSIEQIPVSYYIYCLFDILQSFEFKTQLGIKSMLETNIFFEYLSVEYVYDGEDIRAIYNKDQNLTLAHQKELSHYIYHLCGLRDFRELEERIFSVELGSWSRKSLIQKQRNRFIDHQVQSIANWNGLNSCYNQKSRFHLFKFY